MKNFLAVVVLSQLFSANGIAENLADVSVSVNNIEPSKGRIMVALEKDPASFEMKAISRPLYLGQFINADKISVTVVFEDIPAGTYAIKAFHDENSNQKLDTGLFGIPTELFGFSNDARATFGPPEFKDASFKVDGIAQRHIIKLK